jgi:hypothetical protein
MHAVWWFLLVALVVGLVVFARGLRARTPSGARAT